MTLAAITIKQPKAYLAGCILGDAWLGQALGLKVADLDFAETFSEAINTAYGLSTKVGTDDRGYYLVRRRAGTGIFNDLIDYEPLDDEERGAWLRGLFDSEGNANLYKMRRGERSWSRRVAFYSTNLVTLARCASYLADLGIDTIRSRVNPSVGHLGKKPVYQLCLRQGKRQYELFSACVGSSIERKRQVLLQLPLSYVDDMGAVRREMQARGVMSRRNRRDSGGRY